MICHWHLDLSRVGLADTRTSMAEGNENGRNPAAFRMNLQVTDSRLDELRLSEGVNLPAAHPRATYISSL